jgi:prepilin-type N-terminal cleavage/methylation domain-containing protein
MSFNSGISHSRFSPAPTDRFKPGGGFSNSPKFEPGHGIVLKSSRPQAHRQGFTLIEVLITVAVIAFGCLAVVNLQMASLRGTATADHQTVATFLAESEIERLKSLTWTELIEESDSGGKVEPNLDRNGNSCSSPPNCDGHQYKRTVRFYKGQPTTMSTQVEVEVNWSDNSGAHGVLYTAAMTRLSL